MWGCSAHFLMLNHKACWMHFCFFPSSCYFLFPHLHLFLFSTLSLFCSFSFPVFHLPSLHLLSFRVFYTKLYFKIHFVNYHWWVIVFKLYCYWVVIFQDHWHTIKVIPYMIITERCISRMTCKNQLVLFKKQS